MSRDASLFSLLPEETTRGALAACPTENLLIRMRDTHSSISTNPDVADLFPAAGRRVLTPAERAFISVFQFAADLSDRQAADAVPARIAWKYARALDRTVPSFDASVLCAFCAHLLVSGAEQHLVDAMRSRFTTQGLVQAKVHQRTDAPHMLAAIHVRNRLACISAPLRHTRNARAPAHPKWLRAGIPRVCFERYGRRIEAYRLPDAKTDRSALAASVRRPARGE